MCSVAGVQAVAAVAQVAGQTQTYRANASAANTAYVDQVTGINERNLQEQRGVTDQMNARSRQAMQEIGTMQAIFADSGASGASQDRVIADAERAAAADMTTMDRNRAAINTQANMERVGAAATRTSRINGVARPSLIGAGLQIAGAYLDYKQRTPSKSSAAGAPTIDWNKESGL
jgi:hypothetical protein